MTIRTHLYGCANTPLSYVYALVDAYVTRSHHALAPTISHAEDPDSLALCSSKYDHTTLFCRWSPWWDLLPFLLHHLSQPLLVFHMYEDDFWQYDLYSNQIMIDSYTASWLFYPPDACPDLPTCQQKVHTFLRYWPMGQVATLAHYFIPWTQDDYPYVRTTPPDKAYPQDTYTRGDAWQVADFMEKVGLIFPIAPSRTLLGETYRVIPR